MVYDYSSPLQQEGGGTLQDTMHTSFSGAVSMADIVPLCPCFLLLCVLFTLILHYPDPPRAGPASIGPSPLSLLVGRSVWWDLRTERAAQPIRGPSVVNLGQCPRPSHLHGDRAGQSGVGAGEDFDPSTQWLREA